MPGFKGIEKIELRERLEGADADFIHEATTVIGLERLRAVEPEAMRSVDAARRRFSSLRDLTGPMGEKASNLNRSFDDFLTIGASEDLPQATTVAIPENVHFWRGLGQFLKGNFRQLFGGMSGGLGGPMMIFAGLLGPSGEISPQKLKKMRSLISRDDSEVRRYLPIDKDYFTSLAREVLPSHLLVGELFLDPNGNFVGSSLRMPILLTSKGRTHDKGSLVGTPVRVIVDMEGNLYHYEPLPGENSTKLNTNQEAALQAYLESKPNHAGRQWAQNGFPYLADLALLRKEGTSFQHLNALLAQARDSQGQAQIILGLSKENENWTWQRLDPMKPTPQGISAVVFFEFKPKNRESQTPAQFEFKLLEGQLPSETERFLNFIQQRFKEPT